MRVALIVCATFLLGFAAGQKKSEEAFADEKAQAPGYMVVMGKNYNRDDLMPYAQSLPPIYEKYNGQYIAFTAKYEQFEGEYPYQSIIVSKWPSVDDARAFWDSPEYAEARKLREGIGEFDVIAFDGIPE